jgi:uncharacterized protein YdhG (YjbR/CyaY superfamily)
VSSSEISAYLDGIDEPKRATPQKLRETIMELIPEAEQGLSYQLSAFTMDAKVIAGLQFQE